MLKLYKQQDKNTLYWAAWRNSQKIFLLQGILGGESVSDTLINSTETWNTVEKEAERRLSAGYTKIDDQNLTTIVTQYQIDGWGEEDDLSKRNEVIELMDECQGKSLSVLCTCGIDFCVMSRKIYPSDVSDEEWALVVPYLTLMNLLAPQRSHDLREVFNALRWLARFMLVSAKWGTLALSAWRFSRLARGLSPNSALD